MAVPCSFRNKGNLLKPGSSHARSEMAAAFLRTLENRPGF
jgi:hypothetical protein